MVIEHFNTLLVVRTSPGIVVKAMYNHLSNPGSISTEIFECHW